MNAHSNLGRRITSAWRLPLLAWLALHLCASAPAQTWYWSQASSTLNADITGIAAGGGGEFRFVNTAGKFASGDSTGGTWTERANVAELTDVFWDGANYLACSAAGGVLRGTVSLTQIDNVTYRLNAIASGGGRIVAVGNNGNLRSFNGTTWANANLSAFTAARQSAARFGVAYGANRFVVVGEGGITLWSDNGSSWTLSTATGSKNLNAICWGNNGFVAVGDSGAVVYSSDGKSFSPGTSPTTDRLNGITFGTVAGQAYYVAVSGAGEVFATTNPAGSWTKVGSGLGGGLKDVAINTSGVVVAVGTGPNIRVSTGPLIPVARFSPVGPISQPAVGVKGATVGVTAEPANVNWQWEATVASNPGNMVTLLDASAGKVVKSGNFNLRYDLTANTAEARGARIEIRQVGGTTVLASLAINQGATDSMELSLPTKTVGGAGASYSFTVTPTPSFAWKAVVNPPQNWVSISPPTASGQQSVTVNYGTFTSASANRSATIEFRRASDDKVLAVHTLTQSGLAPPAAAAWGWAPRNVGNGAGWVAVQAGTKGWLAHGEAGSGQRQLFLSYSDN